MTVKPILPVALLCLTVGCQSVERSLDLSSAGLQSASGTSAVDSCETPHPISLAEEPHLAGRGLRVKQVSHLEAIESEDEATAPAPIPESAKPLELTDATLTLDELVCIAEQNNPALAQAAAGIEAAEGSWIQGGLPPNTVIGYSGQQLFSGGAAEQQGLYVGQEFVTGKKLQLNREAAAWRIEQAQHEYETVRMRVMTDVHIGFYKVLIAQRRRELAKELVKISERGVETAEALYRGQEVSQADPLRAKVQADSAAIVLQNSINRHNQAWRQLAAVMGTPDRPLQELQGELQPDDSVLSWDETLRQIIDQSPEMAAATANAQAARWGIERAYAEVVPNVDVQAVVQDDRGTNSANANLQVSLPIPLLNRNQGGIRTAQALAAAAERELDRLTLDLQARMAEAFQRYESARNQVTVYSREGGILEKTDRSLELVQKGYQGGEIGVQDLLSVQRTYFQTNLAYLDALQELWVSISQVQGLLLQDSLSTAGPSD